MPFATSAIRERARKRVAQRVKAGEPCALCGKPIDLTLRYPDPDAFVVDHVVASTHGGGDEYEQLQPSHVSCNRVKGDQPAGTVRRNSGALEP